MVRSQKKGVLLSLLSGILWAAYSVTLYSWLSPYNGDSGTLDSARGVMFIILAAIGIAWIDALITFVFEVGYVAKRGKLKEYLRLLRTKAFFRIMPAALFAGPLGLVPFAIASRYSVSVATSISAFYPALGSIIAMFWFKEKLTPFKFLGILFSISGVVVISGFSGLHPVGIFLAVFASVGYSLELVFGYRLMAEDVDSDVSLALKQTSAIALYTIMLAALLVLFGSCVYLGLEKGMKWLSSATVYITLGFLVVTLLWGPTSYLIDAETNSIGLLASNFVRMSTYTDPHLASGFPQNWTIFYWSWWLAYMPVMGLFVARISRGRTIRQVICGQVLWGSVGCMTVFGIMGGYALYVQRTGIVDLAGILATEGQEAAITALLSTLPLPQLMLVVYLISCFVFLATTISSPAYILSSMTSKKLSGYENPARWNRLLWSVVFMLFSAGIMVVGGMETIKLVCVLAGFPLIAVVLLLMRSIRHMVKTHADPSFPSASRSEPNALTVEHTSS